MIIQSDLVLPLPACSVQMLCQQCSCWQRFRELPWYSAIWHGRPIRRVLPTHSGSVLACGCRFSCRNCDDSDLIIIKSTCMTGCRPLMGLLFHQNGKLGHGEAKRHCGGATCIRVCVHVACLSRPVANKQLARHYSSWARNAFVETDASGCFLWVSCCCEPGNYLTTNVLSVQPQEGETPRLSWAACLCTPRHEWNTYAWKNSSLMTNRISSWSHTSVWISAHWCKQREMALSDEVYQLVSWSLFGSHRKDLP